MISFDTPDNQSLFRGSICEEKMNSKTVVPTRFDIEHAWPLGQVLSSRLNRLIEDAAVADPAVLRSTLERLEERDKQASGDFIFPFTDQAKKLLAILRKYDV